jgi:hypothetical protein
VIITLQPFDRIDSVIGDHVATQRPYPFHVTEDGRINLGPNGDFWNRQGVVRAVGMQRDLDVQTIDVSWSEVVADPQVAIGKYLVTADAHGRFSSHTIAIGEVRGTGDEAS